MNNIFNILDYSIIGIYIIFMLAIGMLMKKYSDRGTDNYFIGGKEVLNFENNFSKYVNSKYCVSVAIGTDALEIALASLNLKKGSEIITPALTFSTNVSPIYQLGYIPHLIDVERNSYIANIDQIIVLFAISAVIGHVYPLYYGFRGGKGAGTLVGVILAVSPSSFLYILASWIIMLVLTGYVGLSTMIAGMSFVVVLYFSKGIEIFSQSLGLFSIFIALFLIFTHRENIMRMYNGNEYQFKKIMLFKSK